MIFNYPHKYIYAFRSPTGVFRYVGQTVTPIDREYAVRRQHASLLGCSFVILRKCPIKEALRIEGQVIRSLKKREECDLNKSLPNPPKRHLLSMSMSWDGIRELLKLSDLAGRTPEEEIVYLLRKEMEEAA